MSETEVIESLPSDLQGKVRNWLKYDKVEETRNEILQLCLKGDITELHKRLDTMIAFGTAGLRGRMEAGFNRMNALTVKQASQGLAKYIKKQFPENLTVVVGHDHRHNSRLFGKVTVDTFLQLGFKVFHLNHENEKSLVHTPLVPFTVNATGASVGIMITASHNPKMDNGYKVYYTNGCQIIPPHDKLIAESIIHNLEPFSSPQTGTIIDCKEKMTKKYIDAIGSTLIDGAVNKKTNEPWFVYTPMHGVGFEIFESISKQLLSLEEGKDYLVVEEQKYPDADFPTVSFPNPEEKGALDLAVEYGRKNDTVDLIIANDPDADRFSVAVRDNDQNTTTAWRQLTGNEIGFLFAYYEWERYKHSPIDEPLAMLNSTVSSQMIKRMAEIEGFHYEDTLTGFKWLGNRALELEQEGYYTPFAYEEAIGYMFSSVVHDKDGISAAIVFLQAYSKWRASGQTVLDILATASLKYGHFKEFNGYYIVPDLAITKQVFDAIRSIESPYPKKLGSSFEIIKFRDLTNGYQSDTPDHIPELASDPSSQMITCEMLLVEQPTSRVRFTIRGSGTEPKLKVYIEARTNTEPNSIALAKFTWDVLRQEWFKPELTGLLTPFQ
ncbi:phosphoribomutase PRM15 [Kluyveromyces lactis]|uniref:phosphopentomutase n=1 Tax=Kluyveromyces lactis (strain ATCC 8585 / CBS 2359 / DSM 70799 / NBRC 1267 / NRRL Y-1140 / WM37) TaxID=284590 RepID=Q6CSF0_KLULA|nr:uncharacterized protein KLLA0_D01573g [Kluyveromyces lactis]CAH00235.1 KLLA0D01573p [Kluyveromyces lactis]|eukprot:XP_453139.1 uncharacterized protein KLLA0_D01573g [Kluyveromyces lactis]